MDNLSALLSPTLRLKAWMILFFAISVLQKCDTKMSMSFSITRLKNTLMVVKFSEDDRWTSL
jgi:hypothetical protein